MAAVALFASLTWCVGVAGAQIPPRVPNDLASISQRGRVLAAYDRAAWHGSDAAEAIAKGDDAGLRFFIARDTAMGWVVDFGELDPTGTAFLTRYEARGTDGAHFLAQKFAPPRSDSGFLPAAAHAILTAEAAFTPVKGYKYNVAVIPNADGTMYVYLYPAQVDRDHFPIGGDERYVLSADGKAILDAHRMHNGIINQSMTSDAQTGTLAGTWHTVIVDDVPQDTDVFWVLARQPAIPDYVSAKGHMYRINVDGSIVDLGSRPVSWKTRWHERRVPERSSIRAA